MTKEEAIGQLTRLRSYCSAEAGTDDRDAATMFMKCGKERQKNRSKTFLSIAKAMAEQWGRICNEVSAE